MYLIFGDGDPHLTISRGWDSFIESHDNKEDAIKRAAELIGSWLVHQICEWSDNRDDDYKTQIEWVQVVDVSANKVIYSIPEQEQRDIVEIRPREGMGFYGCEVKESKPGGYFYIKSSGTKT